MLWGWPTKGDTSSSSKWAGQEALISPCRGEFLGRTSNRAAAVCGDTSFFDPPVGDFLWLSPRKCRGKGGI